VLPSLLPVEQRTLQNASHTGHNSAIQEGYEYSAKYFTTMEDSQGDKWLRDREGEQSKRKMIFARELHMRFLYILRLLYDMVRCSNHLAAFLYSKSEP
jgi:hypothetical protein